MLTRGAKVKYSFRISKYVISFDTRIISWLIIAFMLVLLGALMERFVVSPSKDHAAGRFCIDVEKICERKE